MGESVEMGLLAGTKFAIHQAGRNHTCAGLAFVILIAPVVLGRHYRVAAMVTSEEERPVIRQDSREAAREARFVTWIAGSVSANPSPVEMGKLQGQKVAILQANRRRGVPRERFVMLTVLAVRISLLFVATV